MVNRISRRGILGSAVAAGLQAAAGPVLEPADPIVIAAGPYRSLEDLAAAPWPQSGEPDVERRRSPHTALYAARELRQYLCRLLALDPGDARAFPIRTGRHERGVELVDLSAGGAPEAAVRDVAAGLKTGDSFALVPEGRKLYVVGRGRAGVLYGVYHFLEMQGVRWYAPGEMGEVVPRVSRLALPAETGVSEPAFQTRGFFAWEPRGSREFHVWMARNRLNYWTAAGQGHDFMGRACLRLHAGSHWILEDYLNPTAAYPYPAPAGRSDADGGGKLSFFEARPEWYGLSDGKRTPFKGVFGVNICSSNRGVMAELCRRIVDDLASGRWKDVDILEFWVLDVGKWCQCADCEALGSPTDRLLLMVHQVEQAIARARREGAIRRDLLIFFPIYAETLPAPTRPLPEGFNYRTSIGTLFPIQRCYRHTMDDPACTETNVPIWKTILGWGEGERFYRGEYVMGEYYNVSTSKSLPVLYAGVMSRDIPMYLKHGVRHFHFMHACTRLLGPKRLNQYLMAKLLWDPGADPEAMVDRYCRDFYGPAAGAMRDFYRHLERGMSGIAHWKSGRNRLTARLARDTEPLFPLKHLQMKDLEESAAALGRCRAILDGALAAAGPGVVRDRLLEDGRNLRYAGHTVNLYRLMALALQARRAGDLDRARAHYRAGVPHARGLQAEVEILQTSSSHANAKDGLDASQVGPAWSALGQQLGLDPL